MVHIFLLSSVVWALFVRGRGKALQVMPFAILFFFAAFRYMYGNDYASYFRWYQYIRAGGRSPFDEYLYTLLNIISPSFYVLIALTSFVFVLAIYQLITKTLPMKYIVLGVFIFVVNPYLYLMNLSAIRQCLAMVLFIYAISFAIEKKPLPYILMICLAALFHKSAILLLPCYFIANTKRVKNWTVVTLFGLVATLLLSDQFNTIVRMVVDFLFDDANYLHYLQGSNSLRATILTSLFFIYTLGNLPRLDGKALVYGKLYLIGTVLGVLAYKISMFTRIQMYFDIFAIVALPLIFQNTLSRGPIKINQNNILITIWDVLNKYIFPLLLVIIYFLRYYSFFTNPMWRAFVEYQTIFNVI